MQPPLLRAWRAHLFPALLAGVGVVWLVLALISWLSNAPAVRPVLVLFTGGILLAGFAWYARARWVGRQDPTGLERFRRPATLLLLGWFLCLGSVLASGRARHGESGEGASPSPRTDAAPKAEPPSKLFSAGPVRYLSDLEEVFVRDGPWPLGKNGILNDARLIKVGGKRSPKGLSMHPPSNPAYTAVKYRLHKEAALFKAVAAVDDSTNFCWTPAVFRVLGDGTELWQSKFIAHNHSRSQECLVDVTGVDVLELRVECVGHNLNVYAVWVEPRLLQKRDSEDK